MQARVFLVGCSRSGTTVVQRCLAAHPHVTSFPETDFFGKAVGGRRGRLLARMDRVRAERARAAVRRLAVTLDEPHLEDVDVERLGFRALTDWLVQALDARADEHGASAWVEKTPKHFRYARLIESNVTAARFIHLVRDGRDVVASLVDRARRHPGFAKQLDPQAAVRLWNQAVRAALRNRGRTGHMLLGYEDFVRAPEAELVRLCAGLGLEYHPAMLESADASAIVTADESWKGGASEPVAPRPSKFRQVFSGAERGRIERSLDWRGYRRLFPGRQGRPGDA